MHERSLKVATTYIFPCMILFLCRSTCVPIWYIDPIKTSRGTIDKCIIRGKANEKDPRRGPRPRLPPLGENMDDTVAHAPTAMYAASETTDNTPVE